MKPSVSIANHGNQVREILERAGLRNTRIFGSTARGEDVDGSDLDLLVEAPLGTTLYDLAGVELALEDLLGCRVEVVTAGCLAFDVARKVAADLMPIP